jgi:nucleoside-diphosphate-sugar epimerase
VIFHLAATVSGKCEADFDLGMQANLGTTESLLASCRAAGTNPAVVFASSLAVFGASSEHPLTVNERLPDLLVAADQPGGAAIG